MTTQKATSAANSRGMAARRLPVMTSTSVYGRGACAGLLLRRSHADDHGAAPVEPRSHLSWIDMAAVCGPLDRDACREPKERDQKNVIQENENDESERDGL